MPAQLRAAKARKEGRLLLAKQAYQKRQISSIRKAADTYDVDRNTLAGRIRGRVARAESRAYNRKLTQTEEEALVRWILDMDARGYPPRIHAVREAALLLLRERVGPNKASIGVNWPTRFVKGQPALQAKYTRKYDYQRAQCEDPELIQGWFTRVSDIIAQYGIVSEDTYNFDETGFAMGIAGTSRVVTSSDRRGRPPQLQPGDREWVTAIETINASGWYLPPMVIFKGKMQQSTWYSELPEGSAIGLSENGWTTDKLGLDWLQKIFEPITAPRTIGKYRLLILDGHSSHATPEFDKFCANHSIITLYMPPHSSHLLQPLDVGCFSPLKRVYKSLVADQIRVGINHIDKPEFLAIFKQARLQAYSEDNIRSGFTATGLIPFDPDCVLSQLQIRTHTPPLTSEATQAVLQLETPSNTAQLEQQVKAIKGGRKRRTQSPISPTEQRLDKVIKACEIAMHEAVLAKSEIRELRAANERQKKKREAPRSYIAKEITLTVVEAQEHIQQRERVLNTPTTQGVTQQRSGVLPSCMKCFANDHNTRACARSQ